MNTGHAIFLIFGKRKKNNIHCCFRLHRQGWFFKHDVSKVTERKNITKILGVDLQKRRGKLMLIHMGLFEE